MAKQRVNDTVAVAGKAAGAGITAGLAVSAGGAAVGVPAAVAGLAVQAGLLSTAAGAAAVPVIGWIIAGGAATAAGTIALVAALRRAKVRKGEAIAQAEALGIPDAAEVPGFVVKALNEGPEWRGRAGAKLINKLQRDAKAGRLGKSKSSAKDLSRFRILAILDLQDRATVVSAAPPAATQAEVRREYGPPLETPGASWWPTALAAGIAVLVVAGMYAAVQE